MTPEQWPALSRLLDEALELDPAARGRWLENLPPGSAALTAGLRALLESHARVETSDFLGALPRLDLAGAAAAAGPAGSGFAAGTSIGGYVIEAEAGRGGMSIVYRAHRADGLIRRPVALKVLHAGHYGAEALARFARERDILAGLTHPAIARLYDAGATETGQPYIALEFVEGLPLVAYCDQHRLDLRARLELFGQVLRAVQFAHANLVIHRDLKPSNILVTRDGAVRLLDFGIAKLLPSASAAAELTAAGSRALTPGYSAPEQVTGGAITTATDVYSAAVVLCELLTGQRPYRLPRQSLGALEEAIVAGAPTRPSRTLISPEQALARGTTAQKLRAALAGDLDTIILKALRKEPLARYPTVDALLQDLERHLRDEPVLARPDQPWYRIGKFVARHRLPVALVGALAVAVLVGLGVALWALGTARLHAARAEAAKGFLLKVFSAGNPRSTGGSAITAREILERGSRQIDAELKDQPGLLGELHGEIADVYASIGVNEDALAHAERALALMAATGSQHSESYLKALYRVAHSYTEEERWPEARAAHRRLRDAATAQLGPRNPWESLALEDAIWIEQMNGRLAEATAAANAALELTRALYGERSRQHLRVLGQTEQLYLDRGRPAEALEFTRRVIAIAPYVAGYDLADLLMDHYMLASTLYRLQRYAESAAELRSLLPRMESNMGVGSDHTSKARNTLALDLMQLGELGEATALQRRNIELVKDARLDDPDLVMGQELALARVLARSDRFAEALAIMRRGVRHFDERYSEPTAYREFSRANLGEALLRSGALDEGLAATERAIANLDAIKGYAPDPFYADAVLARGNGLRLLGRASDAQGAFDRACALYDSILGEHSVAALRCRVYQLWGRAAQPDRAGARELLARFRPLRDELLGALPPRQPLRAELLLVEAELERGAGFVAPAAALELQGARAYRELVGGDPQLPLRSLH